MTATPKSRPLGKRLQRAWRFASEEVWDIELGSLTSLRRFGVKTLRVLHLVFKGFREDACPLHASALTFTTLMSIVPILALSLAMARGLGDEEAAKNKIRQMVSEWTSGFKTAATAPAEGTLPAAQAEEAESFQTSDLAREIDALVEKGFQKVENISFKALGGAGLVILVVMVISVLGQVEASFNRVWGVTVGRTAWRRVTDYLSLVLILPFLVVAASSVPIVDFATRYLDEPAAAWLKALVGSAWLKSLTVIVMTALSFTFVIMFMPNTRVKPLAGLAGGFVAGLLFLGWLWVCAALQIGAASAGKIYGSFALVPIMLTWVQVSWEIVLFGAVVAFAIQNCSTYRMDQGSRHASARARVALALSLIREAGRAMAEGKGPCDVDLFARERLVPVRLINDVVGDLVKAGLLIEVSERPGRFVLLRSPSNLSVKDVIDTVIQSGVAPQALGLDRVDPAIQKVMKNMADGVDRSVGHTTVQDLIAAG